MWNVCNKLLERKQRIVSFKKHREALHGMSPYLTIGTPTACPHLARNLKGEQLREEAESQIMQQNKLIRERMIEVGSRKGKRDISRGWSLNQGVRRREAFRIDMQNMKLGMRLELTKSSLNTRELLRETRRSLSYSRNISKNARRHSQLESNTLSSTSRTTFKH